MQNVHGKLSPQQIHERLTKVPATRRDTLMEMCGWSSTATFYDRIRNPKNMSTIEREAFAKVYGVDFQSIDWKDEQPVA